MITHLLSQIPYKPLVHRDVELPKRQKQEHDHPVGPAPLLREIPTPFG